MEREKKGQVKSSRVEFKVDKDFEHGGNANFMADSLASPDRESLGRKNSLGHEI